MYLGYIPFASSFFFSQFNLYLLVILLVLGCSLDKFKFNVSGQKLMSVLNIKFPWSLWFYVTLPFLFLLFITLFFFRSLENLSIIGDLVLTVSVYKWLFFILFFNFILFLSFFFLGFKGASFSIEFFVGCLLLFQVWSWVPFITNWLTMLLFFEIAALILLLFGVYTFNFSGYQTANKYKLQENNQSLELNFLRFFIFFLWLSVIATFLFFWTLAFGYTFWLGFDIHSMLLYNSYVWGNTFSTSFITNFFLGLLCLGFVFKLLLVPLQGILLVIYNTFSFRLILIYFTFYYFFFCFISFFVFGYIFYLFWGGWGFFILFFSLLLLLFLISMLSFDVDFKHIFVISSLVNLTILLLMIV